MNPLQPHIEKLEEYLNEVSHHDAVSDLVDLYWEWDDALWNVEPETDEEDDFKKNKRLDAIDIARIAFIEFSEKVFSTLATLEQELNIPLGTIVHAIALELAQQNPSSDREPIFGIKVSEIPTNHRVTVSTGDVHSIHNLLTYNANRFPDGVLRNPRTNKPFSYFDVMHICAVARENGLATDKIRLPQYLNQPDKPVALFGSERILAPAPLPSALGFFNPHQQVPADGNSPLKKQGECEAKMPPMSRL